VGGVIQKPVKMGEAIRYEDIALREDDLIVKLRRAQDKMVFG
jgi:predicted homoserine dehydrogenase-like protein